MAPGENGFCLQISEKEAKELGLQQGKEYEVLGENGVIVFREKLAQRELEADARIFELMKKKSLSERVEGKFEKLLNEKELERFKQLLSEEKIIAFKLSDKYRKAVYKIAPEKKKESEQAEAKEKPIEEYSVETDGFLVVKNEERAKRLSEQLKEQIQGGKIRGLKSFDGHFYIAETALLEKYNDFALAIIKANKSIALQELAQKTGISRMLTKIVCEFLKEDGEIIERRKQIYQLV